MDEQQVRLLVRQAIARHLGAPAAAPRPARAPESPSPLQAAATAGSAPVSFAQFHLPRPDTDTECLIEPTVTCNHCGHCRCYGH